MTKRHRITLQIWLAARREFVADRTEEALSFFLWADRRLARLVRETGPLVTPRRRFVAAWDVTEKRWRVREERREFHGQEHGQGQGQKGAA